MARFRSKLILPAFLAFLVHCPAVCGREEAIEFSFRTLSAGPGAFQGIHCQVDKLTVSELRFSRFLPSAPLRYRGPSRIVFFRFGISEAGKAERVPVARIEVPDTIERGLLFFREAVSGPLPYSVELVDDSRDAFPADSIRLLNLTGQHLIARVGGDQLTLPPGPSRPLPLGGKAGREFPVKLAIPTPSGPKLAYGNAIDAGSKGRVILVIESTGAGGFRRLRTYAIIERAPDGPKDGSH